MELLAVYVKSVPRENSNVNARKYKIIDRSNRNYSGYFTELTSRKNVLKDGTIILHDYANPCKSAITRIAMEKLDATVRFIDKDECNYKI